MRSLKTTDSAFYAKLTEAKTDIPSANTAMAEPDPDADFIPDGALDDSNLLCSTVVAQVLASNTSAPLVTNWSGGLPLAAQAESLDEGEELGVGKRKCQPNTLYSPSNFWSHHDEDDSEGEN